MGSGGAAAPSIPITTMHLRLFNLSSYSPLFSFLSLSHNSKPNHHSLYPSLSPPHHFFSSFLSSPPLQPITPARYLFIIKLETFGRSLRLLISKVVLLRDDNENRTCGYPPEPNPNLTEKTRYDWVRGRY
ncbi:hypothetical protein Lalb_Chr05g0221261 [Lupinus albus]|uniref:Uncharacterized protein n=1 Tax=Lupinus albus TaxID=3870 RepID=A0A6A4QIQ0_LUPAL|nr:hypothetical protein Lalb_Chr05g0221261 [Lupinus albus]